MALVRKTLIDLNTITYYHCISHCVGLARLCDEDHLIERNYERRKAWGITRLALDVPFCFPYFSSSVIVPVDNKL